MISLFSEGLPIPAQKKNLQGEREGARVLLRSPPALQQRPWRGAVEEKVLQDPARAQEVVVAAGRRRVRQRGLAPGTRKDLVKEGDRGLNWKKKHLRDF